MSFTHIFTYLLIYHADHLSKHRAICDGSSTYVAGFVNLSVLMKPQMCANQPKAGISQNHVTMIGDKKSFLPPPK
jgi:hypothetical protein